MKNGEAFDRNKIWRLCFPHTLAWCKKQGHFIIKRETDLLNAMKLGLRPKSQEDEALLRLELAIACLWPQLQEYFVSDCFPHILACSTDLLRSAAYGKDEEHTAGALAHELANALDSLETLLSWSTSLLAADQLSLEDLDQYESFPSKEFFEQDDL